ncbi:hypothetical protein IL38_23785 [Actinopolyspora erythraea]|uniref:Transposase zinc-binding domain-containing protein n=1 Tax=Actinopolyspora erythraea TaxID=414996 RepID=A0ABR4WY63_9ACTN|nr:hypothetical protein [Actinopolyspora erythraea]KGI79334.1 hypothetical protein IL38_23785 [Actinopolyspora erythraea]
MTPPPQQSCPNAAVLLQRRRRATIGGPIIYLADPWHDGLRHYARMRNKGLVELFHTGGRLTALTLCNGVGEIGTATGGTRDCPTCQAIRADEDAAARQIQRQRHHLATGVSSV